MQSLGAVRIPRRPSDKFFAPRRNWGFTGSMSVEVQRATIACSICSAQVTELRRGRCWGCYARWVESRPVGRGASCAICHEKRRDQLKLVELHSRSVPLCHGCAARIVRMVPVPDTVEEIRLALRRERREADRRGEGLDRRIFPRERRVGERRMPPRDRIPDTDPAMRLPDFGEVVLELQEAEIDPLEQTGVRMRQD
jgi:hypothetical protein